MGIIMTGPLGLLDVATAVDPGTISPQRASPPGPASGNGNPSYYIPGPLLVGKPSRDPGKNEPDKNGVVTVYEDMLSGDAPAKANPIRNDPVFILPDAKLEELGKDLMNSLTNDTISGYPLNAVAMEVWDRFCKGTGGTYTSADLTAAARDNDATRDFVGRFADRLRQTILALKCDLSAFKPLPIDHYAFDSKSDKAGGLGILIHDIWSLKAELTEYNATWDEVTQTGAFYGALLFTLTDDFGLDWNDIVQHGNDHIPPTIGRYNTGDRFKAWYILQHFRKAKPFFIEMKLSYKFGDGSDLTTL